MMCISKRIKDIFVKELKYEVKINNILLIDDNYYVFFEPAYNIKGVEYFTNTGPLAINKITNEYKFTYFTDFLSTYGNRPEYLNYIKKYPNLTYKEIINYVKNRAYLVDSDFFKIVMIYEDSFKSNYLTIERKSISEIELIITNVFFRKLILKFLHDINAIFIKKNDTIFIVEIKLPSSPDNYGFTK